VAGDVLPGGVDMGRSFESRGRGVKEVSCSLGVYLEPC
jgi:hypothetical protein